MGKSPRRKRLMEMDLPEPPPPSLVYIFARPTDRAPGMEGRVKVYSVDNGQLVQQARARHESRNVISEEGRRSSC